MSARTDLIEHIPRLRRYARALTRDAALADDLVQDTLERALRKLDLWRPDSDLRAWLFTLMHNVFINRIRGDARQALERTRLAHSWRWSDIRRDPIKRALVGLEQFGYAETAHILGVPLGTVMSRLSRGRERLRQRLADAPAVKLRVVK